MPLVLTAGGWRRNALFRFLGVIDGVLGAFDGVVQIQFINIDFFGVGRNLLQRFQKFLGLVGHEVNASANVLLFFNSLLNEIAGIVHAANVGVHEVVEHFRVARGGGVVEFVLEFFESFIGELKEKFDAFVGRLGVANLVGFVVGEVVLFDGLRVGACNAEKNDENDEGDAAEG